MPDDLSKLTPTDPSTVDPDWTDKRQDILDGVLADTSRRRRGIGRWIAGVAAAALVAVAVGGVVQQFRPAPYALPASPTPPTSAANGGQVLAARDMLIDTGTGMSLCNGSVLESYPPQCPFPTPVRGISWDDVPWAETASGITFTDAIIVGTFDGDLFNSTQVFRDDDPAAPQPPESGPRPDLPTLCDAPVRGAGSLSTTVLIATAEALPGYQAFWVSPNQVTHNVAVTEDVEGARSALAEVFGGELCVGTVAGPTDQVLKDAQQALTPLKRDLPSDAMTDGSIWYTSPFMSKLGNRLEVNVRRETPALLDEIQAAVGPDVWPHTDIIPFFYPVGGSAIPDPTSRATIPLPPGPATPLVITDEERAWAAESVASDLRDADDTSATATMAKATFEQYEALWDIDVPVPPGPPAGDTEVIVVTLSASLGNRAMRGPIGGHSAPATGTINVIDASTGESVIYATLLGEEPSTDRITDLPGPIEDVKLPEGFR